MLHVQILWARLEKGQDVINHDNWKVEKKTRNEATKRKDDRKFDIIVCLFINDLQHARSQAVSRHDDLSDDEKSPCSSRRRNACFSRDIR